MKALGQFTNKPYFINSSGRCSKRIIPRIHNLHQFYPYKMQFLQEFGEEKPDRRFQFCEIMTTRIAAEPTLIQNIFFNDERVFL